jgi:cysteinyl-tRNA synthetase
LNKAETDSDKQKWKSQLLSDAYMLGLLFQEPDVWFKGAGDDDQTAAIEAKIQARLDAKKNKDWATADAIRNELKEQGIILEDTPQGTTWKKI